MKHEGGEEPHLNFSWLFLQCVGWDHRFYDHLSRWADWNTEVAAENAEINAQWADDSAQEEAPQTWDPWSLDASEDESREAWIGAVSTSETETSEVPTTSEPKEPTTSSSSDETSAAISVIVQELKSTELDDDEGSEDTHLPGSEDPASEIEKAATPFSSEVTHLPGRKSGHEIFNLPADPESLERAINTRLRLKLRAPRRSPRLLNIRLAKTKGHGKTNLKSVTHLDEVDQMPQGGELGNTTEGGGKKSLSDVGSEEQAEIRGDGNEEAAVETEDNLPQTDEPAGRVVGEAQEATTTDEKEASSLADEQLDSQMTEEDTSNASTGVEEPQNEETSSKKSKGNKPKSPKSTRKTKGRGRRRKSSTTW